VLPSLGAVGPGGAQTAQAEAINNRGQVVGNAYLPGSPYQHAVLWSGGTITDLGSLGAYSYAASINDSGEIVGTTASGKSATGDWLQVPFRYAHGTMTDLGQLGQGVMTDLNALLPSNSGWDLQYAMDINNRGQIVGWGLHDGETRAFLLTPHRR
jgi:probable HAF family extracellular repeat protein